MQSSHGEGLFRVGKIAKMAKAPCILSGHLGAAAASLERRERMFSAFSPDVRKLADFDLAQAMRQAHRLKTNVPRMITQQD